jgi:hypothetical protein
LKGRYEIRKKKEDLEEGISFEERNEERSVRSAYCN